MLAEIAINSDNLVRLDSLVNTSTGLPVNTATVTFSLKDSTGTVIISGAAMAFVSNGRYEGTIPNTTVLTPNGLYTVEILAVAGAIKLFRQIACIAKYRSIY